MVNITVEDQRTPVEPAEPTLENTYPLGAFVAYNGITADGQRRRALVVEHGDDGESLVLQDGVERVTVTGDAVEAIVVLAKSADAFAQRVTAKALALGREHNWCSVAETAVRELNNNPATPEETRTALRVAFELDAVFDLLPTRDMTQLVARATDEDPSDVLQRFLQQSFTVYWNDFINSGYFRIQNNPGTDANVTLTIVDKPEETGTTEA